MIRHAKIEDLDSIFELLSQVLTIHHEIRPDIFKEIGTKYTRDELIKIIENENTPIFVFEENGKILGHIFCQIRIKEERPCTYPKKTIFIDDLVVDEKSRGKGVGTALYEFVKEFGRENKFDNILLDVWEGNDKAKDFYKNLGMKPQQIIMEEKI